MKKVEPGQRWRKRGEDGEDATWRVVSRPTEDDQTVMLSGPGPCRSVMEGTVEELVRDWELVDSDGEKTVVKKATIGFVSKEYADKTGMKVGDETFIEGPEE